MKYLIPVAAILILGAVGASRRSVDVSKPSRTLAVGTAREPQPPGVTEIARGSRNSFREAPDATAEEPVVPASRTAAARPDVPASEIQEMLDGLRSKIELTGEQEPRVKDALRRRVRDLQECQQAYRKNGVFVPIEYGKQLIRMKETWFRNIDGILDSEQHERFVQLVNDGFFRPGTDFTVDLSTMTVLR